MTWVVQWENSTGRHLEEAPDQGHSRNPRHRPPQQRNHPNHRLRTRQPGDPDMRLNYLWLTGALACLAMCAVSVYADRGEPTFGFIGCAAFILATLLNLEGESA